MLSLFRLDSSCVASELRDAPIGRDAVDSCYAPAAARVTRKFGNDNPGHARPDSSSGGSKESQETDNGEQHHER